MKLYHVSLDLLHDGVFIPRIPKNRIPNEDSTYKRVCFSDSLEGCLAALPMGTTLEEEIIEDQNGVVRVFEIDTEDFGSTLILTPNQLQFKKLVPDAVVNGEYWIRTTFKAKRTYLIQIQRIKMRKVKEVVSWGNEKAYFSHRKVKKMEYVTSNDPVLEAKLLYPGDEEAELFLELGSRIAGRPLRIRSDETYSTTQNKEDFLYLIASLPLSPYSLQRNIGDYTIEEENGMEKYKLFNNFVIYRELKSLDF